MASYTQAIDNTQDWPVVAVDWCKRITAQENYNSANAPASDLLQKTQSTGTSAAINIAKGTPAIYTPIGKDWFRPGETVGSIRVAPAQSGVTVQIVESNQV